MTPIISILKISSLTTVLATVALTLTSCSGSGVSSRGAARPKALASAPSIPNSTGPEIVTPWFPSLTLGNLVTGTQFLAKVDFVRVREFRGLNGDSEQPKASGAPNILVHVDLTKKDGGRLAFFEWNCNSNFIKFAESLKQGEEYEFPTVILNWARTNTQ